MLLNGREAILSRVHLLKEEISDIQRLNQQYASSAAPYPRSRITPSAAAGWSKSSKN